MPIFVPPADLSGYVTLTGAEALSNKTGVISQWTNDSVYITGASPTIVTPTIASFANAAHSHLNAAGGGTITAAAISDLAAASVAFSNKTGNISQWTNNSGYLTSVTAHSLLSATHGDTTAAAVQRGDLVTGQGGTPAWARLGKGSAGSVLTSDGTDLGWGAPTLISNLTDTWNNGGTEFDAIKMTVTNTASAAQSRLLDLQLDSVPIVRVYKEKELSLFNAFTSLSNFESGGLWWDANVLKLGTKTVGGTQRDMQILAAGKTLTVNAAGFSFADSVNFGYHLNISTGIQIHWLAKLYVESPADGQLLLRNEAGTGFDRLMLGGSTSSFPSLKRSTTALQARLADDSDYAPFAAKSYNVNGTAGAVGGTFTTITSITVLNGIVTAISGS